MTDGLQAHDRTYLDKLKLTVEVLLRAGEESDAINGVLEGELYPLRDALDRALLLSPDAS